MSEVTLVITGPIQSPCPWRSGSAPSGAVFLGLSLALRSHDQLQDSNWFSAPEPPTKKNCLPSQFFSFFSFFFVKPPKELGPPLTFFLTVKKNK